MPVEVRKFSLGTPPTRVIQRGPRKGEVVPRFEVHLPGWDDIIHVTPESSLSPEERREREVRRLQAMRLSPQPEIVRNFSKIGQEIDNVQDALVTLSVAGRVATKIAGRAIPGVGWVASAADMLNVINVFYPKAGRGVVTGTVAQAGAKLSGRSKYALSKNAKRELSILAGSNTGSYRQRLAETLKTGKIGFGWGEALQILQTTDELFGFGVSLGPIFGAMQDTFFGLLRGARFDVTGVTDLGRRAVQASAVSAINPLGFVLPSVFTGVPVKPAVKLQVDWVGVFPLLDRISGRPPGSYERDVEVALEPIKEPAEKAVLKVLNGIGAVKQATVTAAAKVWQASKWVAGVRGDLTWDEHIEIALAQYLALQEIAPFLEQTDWGELAQGHSMSPAGRAILPFASAEEGQSLGELTAILRDGPARFPLDWLAEAPDPVAREFGHGLVASFVDLLLESIEGPGRRVEVESSPLWRAVLWMHDLDFLPPYDREDGEVVRYLESLVSLLSEFHPKRPPLERWKAVYESSFPGVEAG